MADDKVGSRERGRGVSVIFVCFLFVWLTLLHSEPECRRKEAVGFSTDEQLVKREDGSTGCVSDQECTQWTAKDSWCRSDGTCRGCEEGEGCCDLNLHPSGPLVSCAAFPAMTADYMCRARTACDKSVCLENKKCSVCGTSGHGQPSHH